MPLNIDVVSIPIRRVRPLRVVMAWWPYLPVKEWMQYLFQQQPRFLLAGNKPEDYPKWKTVFREFWFRYKSVCEDHPIYDKNWDLGECLPIFIHGDEGRGLARKPWMCIAWQPVISHLGVNKCNDSTYHGKKHRSVLFSYVGCNFDACLWIDFFHISSPSLFLCTRRGN